ncbi:MAG: hypothetical protein HC918_09630 [Oscillatoriales cyanobacterium SM2_1_8]|nr:hypothetical protein [Oscillatoriales cyanobacterium SM2_1_8]
MNGEVGENPPAVLPSLRTLALRLVFRDGTHQDLEFTAANPEIAQGWFRFLQTWVKLY